MITVQLSDPIELQRAAFLEGAAWAWNQRRTLDARYGNNYYLFAEAGVTRAKMTYRRTQPRVVRSPLSDMEYSVINNRLHSRRHARTVWGIADTVHAKDVLLVAELCKDPLEEVIE
jgi:hypothetical protein